MAKTYYTSEIAVALQYDGKNAPKIIAKGEGPTAEQILEIADQHGIPLQSRPELAPILAQIPLGEAIPHELYVAVAEVIAFAYFLTGKTPNSVK
ncbi:MAG: flagellar protein FhlB [Methylobacter sp.]|nr:MAG: flagellar protein FhlB [Methylobacter sp.]PPD02417.1 MAG: flagellar protein FhlB [Methylobacter sp.]PPD21188.1 MAG: flagellar protein FhlB [Methylobacter sp.]